MRDIRGLIAVICDLDGVITHTANVHAAAWKELFDDYLRERGAQFGTSLRPFDEGVDYQRYVDGKPRIDGVLSFLHSRNIKIPLGSASDSPFIRTAWGLGNRKDELFKSKLQRMGVDVDDEAVQFVRELRSRGIRIGLASSSKNAMPILQRVNLVSIFDAVVDGLVSERLHLRGKPEPDIFLRCLKELNSSARPGSAAVIEDAISGVEAAKRGGFGLILAVDRRGIGTLQHHGADMVIRSFQDITADQFVDLFVSRSKAA